MTDETASPPSNGWRWDADLDDLDRDVFPIRGKTGPSENGQAPGEMRVSLPEDYDDPWNPRVQRRARWRDIVYRWIGGGQS